jgi:hypothetical protein
MKHKLSLVEQMILLVLIIFTVYAVFQASLGSL